MSKLLYDLKALGLLYYFKREVIFTKKGIQAKKHDHQELVDLIIESALKTEKVKYAYDKLKSNPSIKSRNFKSEIGGLLEGIESFDYKKSTCRKLYLWAKFIYDKEH